MPSSYIWLEGSVLDIYALVSFHRCILKFLAPLMGGLCLALAGCDAQVAHPNLAGTWTPISTSDCGPTGETIRFTGKRLLYSINGTRLKIGDILGVEKTDAGLELRYTARAKGAPSDQVVSPMRLLFSLERPDRIKAVAEAADGEPLVPIADDELVRVFDLQRCT